MKKINLFKGKNRTSLRFIVIAVLICSPFLQAYSHSPLSPEGSKIVKPQRVTITGTVISAEDNVPIPGVNVVIKGTSTGTTTNFDGEYTIDVESSNSVLVFSYIGFTSKEVPVGNSTKIDVSLEEDVTSLDEVVLVGYGTKRKRDIVSAVSVVDMKEVKDVPATNVSRMLLGQAPGVTVSQSSGRPGQELDIVIRGLSSLGADSKPLYVVDGFAVGTSTNLSINPNDIESISILKDAASTAIYGARGSNGVILITTKTAKEGKVNVTFDMATGIQKIPEKGRFKMLNAVEFGQFQKESWIDRYIFNNEGSRPLESEIPLRIRNPENNIISTDWFDEIVNKAALFKKYDLTVSSGNEKTKSIISLGYLSQDGAIIKTNFERLNVRANISTKIKDNITIGLNLSGSRSRERFLNEDGRSQVIGISLWADPREPVYNKDGSFNDYLGGYNADGDLIFGSLNPVQALNEEKNTRSINRVLSNLFVEFQFLKDFSFKSSANLSFIGERYNYFRPSTLAALSFNSPPPRDAVLREEYTEDLNWSTDQLLTYTKDIGENHHVDALLGYTAQEDIFRNISSTGTRFPDDEIQFLQNAETFQVNSGESSWSLLAFFARLNYNYKGKYLVSATYRREASSRFGANNKWGNFPAVSLGWRISDESFMEDISWINDLKLRGSFGTTGNNNIGNYPSLATLSSDNYILGGNFVPGKVLSSLANPELGWEESKQFNYGVDLTMFNSLTFTGEYYIKTTQNMLLPVNIPAISGFETTFTNIGKVENTGFEFALGYRNRIGENLNLRSNFNISFNENKVLAINGDNDEIRNGAFYGANNVSKVGRPIGMLHGFKNLGVFTSVEEINTSPTQDGAIPGSFKYLDANGDGVVSYDTADWVEIGNPNPDFVWSYNLGLDYKAFDFNVVLTGAQNYDVYRNIESTTLNLDGVFNVETRAKNRFRSPENPGNGRIPTTLNYKWERESNSFYVYDGSHMWIKNVSIGYTIPLRPDGFISSTRLYINADNVYLFTKYPGGNPDVNSAGGINLGRDESAYPIPRTITIGATMKF